MLAGAVDTFWRVMRLGGERSDFQRRAVLTLPKRRVMRLPRPGCRVKAKACARGLRVE